MTSYCWIMDSGGAGRGAWQGGIIYEFMLWCRKNGCMPTVTMGASAGGYAAADVATGTERTVIKGWLEQMQRDSSAGFHPDLKMTGFRSNLHASVFYVMEEDELSGIFDSGADKKLLVFTTRVRRKDGKGFEGIDRFRYFMKSATRKMPQSLKYLPGNYIEDPVIFATNLPRELESEYVRPLTGGNYHSVLEASCLVPFAMGAPMAPGDVTVNSCEIDQGAVFLDGGYALKMPMGMFEQDPRFRGIAHWAASDKTIIFCCDPEGYLWETSARLRRLNTLPSVAKALEENRLLVVHPDHKVEAGFLCTDNPTIMKTFNRGREQAQRLQKLENLRRFFDI
jgi:hypothetical protein